jgi:DNA-binding SARP family transcriptional activator/tetratricopeptide (TPR) repeat protein
MGTEFHLLGPIETIKDGRRVELSRRRERSLLALLLLEAGRPIPTERLIDLLWEDDPPQDPRRAIQVSVSRLRRWLSTVCESSDNVRLATVASGYAIHTDPSTVDVHRFTALIGQARRCEQPIDRARLLREALTLWQGTPLADLSSDRFCQPIRDRLEELRLDALERRVEADLDCGRHLELIHELAELTARYPTRERLIAFRMLALHRASRKQDALAVFQETADRLVEETGLDPGQGLRTLRTEILRDGSSLECPQSATPASPIQPAQLPADLPLFTGRGDELADVLDLATACPAAAAVTVDGMPGVGKTALAVHAAHRLAPRFPDGALYLDLHGFTDGVDPVGPGDALERMLRALGVPSGQIPIGTEDRAALFRSVLADRRILILLDNAATETQVEPLLPAAGSLALVTSRHRLAGLDQASGVCLEILPLDDAVTLFTNAAGASRVAGESSELIEQVVELCGRLPLAIRLAAARLRGRPAWSLTYLLDRLGDEHQRLGEVEAGERSLTSALDLSYRHLSRDQRHLLRRLGLLPGPDFDPLTAAVVADVAPREAERLLDELLDAHLLQQLRPDRYRLHDLVRTYASSRVASDEPDGTRDEALGRLSDWYLHSVSVAMGRLEPHRPLAFDVPRRTAATPELIDYDQAMAWLESEHQNLMAVVQLASAQGWHAYTRDLALAMDRYFYIRGYRDDWIASHRLALTATRELDDPTGEAEVLNSLGIVYGRIGQHADAVEFLKAALTLRRRVGDRLGEARALNNLGAASWLAGHGTGAIGPLARALVLRRELGDRQGEATALNNLGFTSLRIGRYAEAMDHLLAALELRRETGDRRGEASTLDNLGALYLALGSDERAEECLRRALELHRATRHRDGEAEARTGLGRLYARLGRHRDAREQHERALALGREIGHVRLEADALNGLGELARDIGRPGEALGHHRAALTLVEHAGDPYNQAHAHRGIGRALLDVGDSSAAGHHLATARRLFATLGAPDVDEVDTELAVAHPA